MKQLSSDIYKSPIGDIIVVAEGKKLCFFDFNDNPDRIEKLLTRRFGDYGLNQVDNLLGLRKIMDRYFAGEWEVYSEIELETLGTEFQQKVWRTLQEIPVGTTLSYNQLAEKIGSPKAVRAVASANANNPIAIIIPCHRVIGKNGAMRGYAGGIDRKVWLLKHEQAII